MNIRFASRWQLAMAGTALSLLSTAALGQSPPAADPQSAADSPTTATYTDATDSTDASSYSLGLVFGSQLHSSGLGEQVSLEAVMRGLKDGLGGKELAPADRDRAMQLMHNGREAVAARNHVAASEFLAKNGNAPGIKTTPSGLQYQVFTAGDAKGPSPTLNDRVTVHYRGRLLDGTEFDNSDNHAQAATFGLNGVIKGWREALPMMKPGAKWRLFVPPELGYDLNSPPSIPPGSLLIFDVELVKVEPRPVMGSPSTKPGPAATKPRNQPPGS